MRSFKWTIYRAELDPVIGSEIGKSRPVLVISENYVNQLLNAVNIIPITSRKTVEKYIGTRRLFHIRALALKMNPSYSVTKFEQLISDKARLSKVYGDVFDPHVRKQVMDALCFQFGILR